MASDGNEPIRMEAAREGLCSGVDAKGLLKERDKRKMFHFSTMNQPRNRQFSESEKLIL